jgi:hypothetical protein
VSWGYKYVCGFKGHPMANKNGAILEHRYVMSQYLGRVLTREEIVHHLNGNKKDNRIDNLKLVSKRTHPKEHPKEKRYIKLKCSGCGNNFVKAYNQYATKKKRGQDDFYCNRSCMGNHFGNGRIKTEREKE